jgi:hypothetical protein
MDVSIELVMSILVAIGGLAAAAFGNQKYQAAKEPFVEFIGDLADFLAIVYAIGKAEKCDPETLKSLVSKVEEIWTDAQALGPTFEALLAQKSSLAEALERKT